MKRWWSALIVLLTAAAAAQISPQFFGMHDIALSDPWPTTVGVEFSSWRSVGSQVKWSDINTAPGIYNWTNLDSWLAYAAANGQSVLYTFYYTPGWASQCPTCVCNSGFEAPGGCYPPNDLNADGSGTDQYVKDFVTALMQHVGPGKVKYIEVWNEPNIPSEYMGTVQQLVSMARDVRQIARFYDPNISIISPPETGDGPDSSQMAYLAAYLGAGGGPYVDAIGLHGYVKQPEKIIPRIRNTITVMQQYQQTGKPIYVTEASWCMVSPCYNHIPTASQQGGFTFRQYLAALSTPVSSFYLFAYDSNSEGNIWNSPQGHITPAGTAYQLFYTWLVGATMTQPCGPQTAGSLVWSCTFTRLGGYEAEAIWNTGLASRIIPVSVPTQFVQYRDLLGNVYPIVNHQVMVAYSPIWLENMNPP